MECDYAYEHVTVNTHLMWTELQFVVDFNAYAFL